MAIELNNENFENIISNTAKPLIIDVYASWCGPCRQMEPIFEEMEQLFGQDCSFAKLNVDDAREISINYGVTSVPTIIFIKNGNVVSKQTGYMNSDDFKETIEHFLSLSA